MMDEAVGRGVSRFDCLGERGNGEPSLQMIVVAP